MKLDLIEILFISGLLLLNIGVYYYTVSIWLCFIITGIVLITLSFIAWSKP